MRRVRPDEPISPVDELQRVLSAASYCRDLAELEQLDLTDYLRSTATSDELSASERLRLLAITAELNVFGTQPRVWLALERIYQAAVVLDPSDAVIAHSRVISAIECATFAEADSVALRIMNTAVAVAITTTERHPNDPESFDTLGAALYSHSQHTPAEALAAFDRALLLDPGIQHARLFRAHCLHDLERWPEAAAAYSDVDPAYFTGHRAWRYDLLREQRAWCQLRAGDADAAIEETRRLVERYEKQPALFAKQVLPHIAHLADADTTGELRRRLDKLMAADR